MTGLLLTAVLGACAERVPKRVTVVPHEVKSIDTIERYEPSTLTHKRYYHYEFCDETPPVNLEEREAVYNIGDTILYIYYEY